MKKAWKILLWVFVAILAILIFLYCYGKYGGGITVYLNRVYEEKVQREYEEGRRQFEAILRADQAGGKTPEETMEMFLLALKENDAQKASSYYEYEAKEKALINLNKELREKGNLNQPSEYFVRLLESGTKSCRDKNSCVFEFVYITDKDEYVSIKGMDTKVFVPKGSRERELVALELNEFSGVWKITQPY